MRSAFALLWLVIIGLNAAQHDPSSGLTQALVILTGLGGAALLMREELVRLSGDADFRFVLLVFTIPLLLMAAADREFERSDYTTQIGIAMVFVTATAVAMRDDLRQAVAIAAYVIVVAAVLLNLYELFIQNNTWSIAPGRSAGFYVNPNISGQALVGYGLVALTARMDRLRLHDWLLIALMLVGVFTTFSRTAIMLSLVLLAALIAMRVQRGQAAGLVLALLALPFAAYGLLNFALEQIDLSPDAQMRLLSLLESLGLGDYESERGDTAAASIQLLEEHPILGNGVRTTYEMIEGPHNMYVGVLVDYGVFGLVAYLALIARLAWIGAQAGIGPNPVLFFVGWLVLFGLASHTMLGDTATIPLFGIALAQAIRMHAIHHAWREIGEPTR